MHVALLEGGGCQGKATLSEKGEDNKEQIFKLSPRMIKGKFDLTKYKGLLKLYNFICQHMFNMIYYNFNNQI